MGDKGTNEAEYELTGTMGEGCETVILDHAPALYRTLSFLVGQRVIVKLRKYRKRRSDRQNRYIHGVVVPIVRHWMKEQEGEAPSHNKVYTWLRVELLGDDISIETLMGREIITLEGKRFSRMDTKEFADAIETILNKMAEKGCVIPEPNQENFLGDHLTDD